ncbi:MAG: radical SAM protein [Deltaproteobacteria bacterium]|nr:radical SAM protein [Deltaproteobacteria bacterium]
MKVFSAPLSVFISITYTCNLRCKHCAVYWGQNSYRDLETDTWLRFFRELSDLKVFRVRISGGEPLMRKDIWQLMDSIHELPMRLALNTNAILVDRQCAQRLAQYDKMDEIMVSLDGSCPETHDPLRGEGTFRAVIHGVEHLAQFPVPLSFYCTVNRYNVNDLEGIAKLAKHFECMAIKFNDLLPEGRGLENYKELALSRHEWTMALGRLRELRRDYGPMISGTMLEQGEIYDSLSQLTPEEQLDASSNTLCGCGALIQECAVRPDGWIVPCDRLPSLRAGHIDERRFAEIWRSSEVFEQFRKRREISLRDLPECRGCLYKSRCTGGCPAVPSALFGNFNTRDPLGCYRVYLGMEDFRGISA